MKLLLEKQLERVKKLLVLNSASRKWRLLTCDERREQEEEGNLYLEIKEAVDSGEES